MKQNIAPAVISEADFDRIMDATQTLMHLEPGHVLTAEEIDGLRLLDASNREDAERAQDAFSSGYDCGLKRAAGVDGAKLIEERDDARTHVSLSAATSAFSERHAFIRGARACREMMARFVEQGGDGATAASIRANWRPTWGADPGRPSEKAYAEAAPCDIRERAKELREAARPHPEQVAP